MTRRNALFGVGVLAAAVSLGAAAKGFAVQKEPKVLNVGGTWTGLWGPYAPPPLDGKEPGEKKGSYTIQQRQMDCRVEQLKSGKWQAVFEGECGRPYKYTIQMLGRQSGDAILFNGSADLGEKDGGVYDWIGRATEKEFVGFFSSSNYTGNFRLSRGAFKP